MAFTHLNDDYISRYEQLDAEFQPFKEMYKLITKYVWPTAGNFLEWDEPSQQITSVYEEIFDNTTEQAVRAMAAGNMAGNMSPSLKWHRITTADPDLAKNPSVKTWLDQVEDILYGIYNRSNLYWVAHRGFEEQAAFGTEAIFIEDDFRKGINAKIFTAGEYRVALGPDGNPDTLYRKTQITARNMTSMFGEDKVTDTVKRAAKNTPFHPFTVLHVLEPNNERNPNFQDPLNMPFKSVWMQEGVRDKRLRDGGFSDQPFAVTRMSVRGNWPYGIGPGMSAFGMTRVLQEMEKSSLVGIHRQVSPPLVGNERFKGILDLMPDAINWSSGSEDPFLRPLYQVAFSIDKLEQKQAEIRARISRNFYVDLFLMFSEAAASGRQVTATEVAEKAAEKRLQLGPMVEAQSREKLDPIVSRVFNIGLRRGWFPPAPDELLQQPLRIEFVGLLAQAQKLVELQGISTYLGVVERVASLDQNVLVRPDFDQMLLKAADITGISPELNRSDDEVMQIEEAKQAALAQERALMEENANLENVQKASEIDIDKLREMQTGAQ